MHKRLLLVENSDTIRGAVEGLLRQNGYEVYSVPTAERALQVAKASRPDLMIVNSGSAISDGTPLFKLLASAPASEAVAMLVITDQPAGSLAIPSEIEVALPIDPVSFMDKVNKCISGSGGQDQSNQSAPSQGQAAGNQLDHALGLDRIEVTDSEIMDRTAMGRNALRVVDESGRPQTGAAKDASGRVGSISVTEDQSEVRLSPDKKPAPGPSESAALNILNDADQYAIDNPASLDPSGMETNHDYDWFVKEMQRDDAAPASPPASGGSRTPTPPPAPPKEKIVTQEPVAAKAQKPQPVIEPPATPPRSERPPEMPAVGEHTGAVAQFIDEFKKEVQKFNDQEPESIVIKEDPPAPEASAPKASQWEETEETVTRGKVDSYSEKFAADLAQRVAELIVDKIDPDQLAALIKEAARSGRPNNR
jgi:hypothetical protein